MSLCNLCICCCSLLFCCDFILQTLWWGKSPTGTIMVILSLYYLCMIMYYVCLLLGFINELILHVGWSAGRLTARTNKHGGVLLCECLCAIVNELLWWKLEIRTTGGWYRPETFIWVVYICIQTSSLSPHLGLFVCVTQRALLIRADAWLIYLDRQCVCL